MMSLSVALLVQVIGSVAVALCFVIGEKDAGLFGIVVLVALDAHLVQAFRQAQDQDGDSDHV